jgi:hypothetical protein
MRASDLIKALGGRMGLACCPLHGSNEAPSLSITRGRGGKIVLHCYGGCSQEAVIAKLREMRLWPDDSGDMIHETAAQRDRRQRRDADREKETRRREAFVTDLWQRTWERAKPATQELRRWFEHRLGRTRAALLDLEGMPLRWSRDCPRGGNTAPAMVALMTDPETGSATGIHRTFLKADGSGEADSDLVRMMLGRAGVIRLSPHDVKLTLGICEGIENGVALLTLPGFHTIWACGSLNGLIDFPILDYVDTIHVFADPKPHERAGARACAQRWANDGRAAKIWEPPGDQDFNDLIRGMRND